jgi:ERCC4-type nuclease
MKILVDSREPTDLFAYLQNLIDENTNTNTNTNQATIILEKKALDIGDIAVFKNHEPASAQKNQTQTQTQIQIPDIIFERKSIKDLLASIKDGRYKEQSYRLNNYPQHNHNIFYIIEGSLEKIPSAQKQMIYSSIFSISHYKGFSIINSNNLKHTCEIIFRFSDKFLRENKKIPFYKFANANANANLEDNQTKQTNQEDKDSVANLKIDVKLDERLLKKQKQDEVKKEEELKEQREADGMYSAMLKSTKKSNITQANILEIMLMQIPGVSSRVAQAISHKFKSMANLIKNLEENKTCLNEIILAGNRKINKPTINNIFTYILQKNEMNVDA